MPSPSSARDAQFDAIARETGFDADAVAAMYDRIVAGGGRMAQFDHPAFGGSGQWMQGGMTMIGDMGNDGLRERVRRLCDALVAVAGGGAGDASGDWRRGGSQLSGGTSSVEDPQRLAGADGTRSHPAPGATGDARQGPATWYPAGLGRPDSSGTQNHARYAWFASARRLAIDDGHGVTVYDTGDHRIGGVSQQQGVDRSVAFTSQHGVVDLASLPVVARGDAGGDGLASDAGGAEGGRAAVTDETLAAAHRAPMRPQPPADGSGDGADDRGSDPFAALEKLADLHARGIVDDEEYRTKKAELLGRI